MLILDSPGQLVGYIHCRTCRRCVHVDPEMFPPAPIPESYRARLRCSKCGGRGADIRIGWATPRSAPPVGQVVFLSKRARNPRRHGVEDSSA
jgi:hypothetical protein